LNIRLLFPRLLVLGASLLLTASVIGQSSEAEPTLPRPAINSDRSIRLETQPSVSAEEGRPRTVEAKPTTKPIDFAPAIHLNGRLDQLLLTAIQSHLGASYHFNRTGPDEFDCSGFVWRAFQDVGLNFQRGPARSYWATMPAPPEGEQFKFGTLVFFSNLSHVGIVVDEKGFYHSARHGGVMYSPFNDYWLSRIDGFRRVPLESAPDAASKVRTFKPAVSSVSVEENDQP
jgi:cell wall-associated NlpC family hydrolase